MNVAIVMKTIQEIKELAQKYAKLRIELNMLKEAEKPISMEMDQIKDELHQALVDQDLNSVKDSEGYSYTRVKKAGVFIKDPVIALNWAIERRAVSLDTTRIKQMLKDVPAANFPEGYEYAETEYVSVVSPKIKK